MRTRLKILHLLILSILYSCGSSNYSGVPSQYETNQAGEVREQAYKAQEVMPQRKLIYSATLDMMVPKPDTTLKQILILTERLGGYMLQSSSSSMNIRVPVIHFEEAIEEISQYGKVKDLNRYTEDITFEYHDFSIRLENAERARQRYLELLAEAKDVSETLLVERELERLNETIESMKGRINTFDELERMATLRVNVDLQKKPGPLGYIFKGLYKGVRWLFVRN